MPTAAETDKVYLCRAGLQSYARAWEWQRRWCARRRTGEVPDLLLMLEHPPTYTCGRTTRPEHLLHSQAELKRTGCEFYEIERGGSVTFHGPGQVVAYPLLDLRRWHRDIHRYMRCLEQVLVRSLDAFGLCAHAGEDARGVWVGKDKIGSIGIHVKHWITRHGLALNVSTDLSFFDHILPCGQNRERITTMARLLGEAPLQYDVEEELAYQFATISEVELIPISLQDLLFRVESRTHTAGIAGSNIAS